MININEIPTPFYIVYEERLRRNLQIIRRVWDDAGVQIIMAFKANALWKTFPVISEYVRASTASSLNEMRLSLDYLKGSVHTYCPVYTDATFPEFVKGSTHITFNSVSQYMRFSGMLEEWNATPGHHHVSPGLRVNPQCSVIDTDIYNPCLPGSRFGVTADMLGDALPQGVEGLHFHALCESSADDLEKVLGAFESQFGHWLPSVKWVNMGGGHLMTREGYDVDKLISLLKDFRSRYPHISVIMEPGSAFTWRTGDLVASVLDVVDNQGIKTAIIDASFACHMPDCLEMPYKPVISEALPDAGTGGTAYRMGGNSCLSGDYVGDWYFASPLIPGQRLTFEDMNHYTTVKTNMFNGIQHPSIWYAAADGTLVCLRRFGYEDYRDRMD